MKLDGLKVVVTGKIAGESRSTAEAKLRDAGAQVQSAVTSETNFLVCGAKVGRVKLEKAVSLGADLISWDEIMYAARNGTDIEGEHDAPAPVERLHARTIAPQLAKAQKAVPKGESWLHEVKWDGYRGIATVQGGKVALQSRSAKSDYTEQFPAIVRELAAFPDCILDGELVVLDEQGVSSVESMGKGEASFIVFDVLEIEGRDLRSLPLSDRKELLAAFLLSVPGAPSRIAPSPVFDDGEELLAYVKERGHEGIVSKRRWSSYVEGSRTESWVKVKIRNEQEFAVMGWVPGEGDRSGLAGSLILAVVAGEDSEGPYFRYCGRVGTGGDDGQWESFTRYAVNEQGPSFQLDLAGYKPPANVVWLHEELVVQVQFQRWTPDGRLWHPSVVAVRDDKSPFECRRET